MVRLMLLAAVALLMTAGVAGAQEKPATGGQTKTKKTATKAKSQTLVGTVSDDSCGAKHTMMPGKSDAECTRACVAQGAKYALVVGSKVYTLEGHSSELDKLAGEKAKVTGAVSGKTVTVASVAAVPPAKAAPAKKGKKS
jgi:hypothetical protein